MTPFQIVSLSALAALLGLELFRLRREPVLRGSAWLRFLVWWSAALAIARPDAVQWAAESVGIHRGADLVFYLFVLAFLGVSFYFYSRVVRLQRQITQLVRLQAIEQARRGGPTA